MPTLHTERTHRDLALRLDIPAPKLRQLLAARVAELEIEHARSVDLEKLEGGGRRYLGSVEIRRRMQSLAMVSDLLDPTVTYQLSLADLDALDLMGG